MAKIADLYEGVSVTALDYPGTLDSLAPSFLGLGLTEPAYRIRQLLVSASTAHERRKRPPS
jgi:hypothetical protein